MLKDSAALANVIQTYTHAKKLNKGKELHAKLIRECCKPCIYVINHLLLLYAKCGQPDYARKLFDQMPRRNLVSWTAMVTAFSQNSRYSDSLKTLTCMLVAGIIPTQFALTSAIQAARALNLKSVGIGKQIHCLSVKCGFNHELFVGSNLADMYSKYGDIYDACKVFEEMPHKDEVSWTSMIDGCTKNGSSEEALLAFKNMIHAGFWIDDYVVCSALSACGAVKGLNYGKCLHSIIIKLGFEKETVLGNALIDVYSKAGDLESASRVFNNNSRRMNIVSYTTLIDGYVEAGQIDKALNIFVELNRRNILPNEFTFSSLIKGCANQAALEQGMQLHAQLVKYNSVKDLFVLSSLVDMYGKCGLVDHSLCLFKVIEHPNIILWNSFLGVYSQHGLGKEAIKFFDEMGLRGMKPNSITFINVLIGCSHAGLVDEGLKYFYSMDNTYHVKPKAEHYSCIIDLLSRAGKLKEAEEFINCMPFEPNAFGWCSYLAACRIHGDKERGKIAAEKLMKLEPENSGAHVLLSNIYAKEKQWEDVRSLRKMIRDGNLKKLPGHSQVDVGNKTYVFEAEDWSHPEKTEIYKKLDCLADQIKKEGYTPSIDLIPYDVDDSVKEKMLRHHSEKIAVAFALIAVSAWKPIIVKKNLRVCLDCHSAIKLISKVTGRKIIVRDNSRFHHFVDGSCSCGDYW